VNTTTNGVVSLGFETVYDKYFSRKGAEEIKPALLAAELEPDADADARAGA
jgi:hypothetical protein